MKRKTNSYYFDKDSRDKIIQAMKNLKDEGITKEQFLIKYLSGSPSLSRTTFYRVTSDQTVSMATIKAVEYALNKSKYLKDGEKLGYIHESERKAEQENKNCKVNNTINEDNQDLLTTSEPSNSQSLVSTVNFNGRNDHESDDLCATTQKIQKTIEQRIKEKCGKIRILKMREPISTLELYVNIDIYIDICSQQNKQRLHLDNIFTKELVKIDNENQPHSQRLIVIGSTGSGKTMLLRRLALSCFQENSFLKEKKHFPIYIRFREYTENKEKIQDLEQYIVSEYNIDISDINLLSKTGQLLILLDGFDSIESDHKKFVHDQINRFIDRFPNNDYIIACRTEDLIFERLEKVELSPLDYQQIRTLVENRIKVNSPDLSEDQKNELLSQIQNDLGLLLIAKNPLLLVLICLICAERGIEGVKKQK
ncbi:NACHT domain-containing protein [Dolichospermum planctonicum]|uniref:Signal transduction protein with Nacht domain, putative n=2 Tax=Nostocales TaxID=1161 RepID=A0A480A9Y1_9CYAN|nr:NACHT domain-containing protein [Dolichospermum planctonicum]GCL41312.1 signal transduction protein with Nacht domain, putative [Dolichospermum planctonicum]